MFKNIFANIVGRFWSILSNYLFIPIYISLLGLESYSIIGFSLILVSIMGIMDAALSATLSREFSKADKDVDYKKSVLDTLEVCYWLGAFLLIFIVVISSDNIADHWITLKTLDVHYVSDALKIFGVAMAFQLLGNFYFGGLLGLEYQVSANIYQIIWGILRNGLVLVVILFKPSLIYFFTWQAGITLIYVIFLRKLLIKKLFINSESRRKWGFNKKILKETGKFAGGMALISIVAAINTQLDKITISKLFPIEELGFYNIALSLSQSLIVLVNPISTALLPRFTALYSAEKKDDAEKLFDNVFLLVSVLVFSIAANIMFQSYNLIYAWTGKDTIALEASKYVFYSALGTAFLSLLLIPFNIAVANGYTRLNNIIGICSLFLSIPGYWYMVPKFGPRGASVVWCFIQALIMPIYLYYINKKFFNNKSFFKLLTKQIIFPGVLAIIIAFSLFKVWPETSSRAFKLLNLAGATLITFLILILLTYPINKIRNFFMIIKIKLGTKTS